jgi:hypothetical protein
MPTDGRKNSLSPAKMLDTMSLSDVGILVFQNRLHIHIVRKLILIGQGSTISWASFILASRSWIRMQTVEFVVVE